MYSAEQSQHSVDTTRDQVSKYTSKTSSGESVHHDDPTWPGSLVELDAAVESKRSAFMSKRSMSSSSSSKYGEVKRSSASDVKAEEDGISRFSSLSQNQCLIDGDSKRSMASSERVASSSFLCSRKSSDRLLGSAGESDRRAVAESTEGSENITRPRSGRETRSRPLTIDLFRDDFEQKMKDMIRKFDMRCSRSFWEDDLSDDRRVDSMFDRETRSFEKRAKAINDRFFSSRIGSFFDDDDDFFGRPLLRSRRAVDDFDEGDSGIFSDVTSRRRVTDDQLDLDQQMKREKSVTPDRFEVDIDVKGFKANDLMVKTEGNRVIVSAKAKDAELEKGDDPNIKSRELRREFDLPEEVDPYDVVSNLMPDGFLRVEAPLKHRCAIQGQLTSDTAGSSSYQYSSQSTSNRMAGERHLEFP